MTEKLSGVLLALLFSLLLAASIGIGTPARAANEVIASAGHTLSIDVRKGTLIRVERPVATVFVADPAIADVQVKTPTLIYVYAKRVGETVIYGVTDDEEVVLNRTLRVNHNLGRLQGAINAFVPGTNVRAVSLDGALMLQGAVSTPAESEDVRRIAASFVSDPDNIVNRVAVTGPNQVHLKVKVAEISRDVVKQLGINWESLIGVTGDFAIGFATGRDVIQAGNIIRGTGSDTASASFSDGTNDLNVVIDALDNEGLVSILAEPSLTAMSGESARFLAGGEFPIPVSQDGDSITIAFKEFGVALAFTPTIIGADLINLKVAPEVSQLSTAGAVETEGFNVPALTTRRAETTVELASGQSFAIAGLLQNNVTEAIRKFPGLGDLPVIGRLFRSEQFNRAETELVIVATPYIVRPVSGKMALPTDGFQPADDAGRVLHGHLYRQSTGAPQANPVRPHGVRQNAAPVGFILD